jgi:hypothetical protein
MMALSLLLKSPLVGFFFTQRVIHALVVVAYLLFCSIGFLFLANCHCAQIPCIGHETDD